MQIMPLTYADGDLAEIAGRIVEIFFPEQIAEFWRVGALVHRPILRRSSFSWTAR